LTYALRHYKVELKESWYEKLHRWDDACSAYERKQRENPQNVLWTLGRMRCQHALGEWAPLCRLARDTWHSGMLQDVEMRGEVARLGAAAAWNLRLWDDMEAYCASIPKVSFHFNFFQAVLAIHSNRYREAQAHIDNARMQLDSEFTASVGESYRRAYRGMIQVQQLSELEEMLLHKKGASAMPLVLLINMWRGRLVQAQCDVDVWQEILSVRYLVAPPTLDTQTWLKYSALCRKSGKLAIGHKVLTQIIGVDPTHQREEELLAQQPLVAFAYIKQLWDDGTREEALKRLRNLVRAPQTSEDPNLAAKAWLKLGTWQRMVVESHNTDESSSTIFHSLCRATELNTESYKAWHAWAMLNFEAVAHCNGMAKHVVPAITGFFRSIALGRERALQDTLRLLTLWFKYGAAPTVNEAVQGGFSSIPIDMWLSVTPQVSKPQCFQPQCNIT